MATLPSYYKDAEARCDDACLATQPLGIMSAGGNAQIIYILHLAADPTCEHCANYPRPSADAIYQILESIVIKARRAGPKP